MKAVPSEILWERQMAAAENIKGENRLRTDPERGIMPVSVSYTHLHQVCSIHGTAHVTEAPGVDDRHGLQPDLSRQNVALFYIHVTRILSACFDEKSKENKEITVCVRFQF